MLHFAVEAAFDDLLTRWRQHTNRQRSGKVPLPELAASRQRLDHARERMHRLRQTVHPERHELESVVETVWCETLEVVVHLRWQDQHPTRPGNFACACRQLLPIDWDRVGLQDRS